MPTRYLKAGICDSERINTLSAEAETLFYRLLVNVDDFGRMDARPALVKAYCFPVKDSVTAKACEKLMAELVKAELILLYEVGGKSYLQMQKWDSVPRAKSSKCPSPAHACIQLHTDVMQARTDAKQLHTNLPVTGTGTETGTDFCTEPLTRSMPDVLPKPPPKPEPEAIASLPLVDGTEWPVSEGTVREWSVAYPGVDVPQQVRQMRAWLLANQSRRKTAKGIARFAVGWLTREQDRGRGSTPKAADDAWMQRAA